MTRSRQIGTLLERTSRRLFQSGTMSIAQAYFWSLVSVNLHVHHFDHWFAKVLSFSSFFCGLGGILNTKILYLGTQAVGSSVLRDLIEIECL